MMRFDSSRRLRIFAGIGSCLALLAIFWACSWAASREKSPTYDEPLKATAVWTQRYMADYRVSPEDPPLWYSIPALAYSPNSITIDASDFLWRSLPSMPSNRWTWSGRTLFNTRGNDGQEIVQKARGLMVFFGLALGMLIAIWAWQLGGWIAAIAALMIYVFDPNFLAHAPLIKSDVALAMFYLGTFWAVWLVGRRVTWTRLISFVFPAAVGCVKFSGLLALCIVIALLLLRALLSESWPCFGRDLGSRLPRLLAAMVLSLLCVLAAWATIWATYHFRYSATPDPTIQLDTGIWLKQLENLEREQNPDAYKTKPWTAPLSVKAALFAETKHLLPQAYCNGFVAIVSSLVGNATFLCGKINLTGWWYYFPCALVFKSPLATLLAMAVAPLALFSSLRFGREQSSRTSWSVVCLLLPPSVFLGLAMAGRCQIGLRHILCVFPFLFIALGLALTQIWKGWKRPGQYAIVILGLALVAESLWAYPNYLAFFNVAAGGARGGFKLLSDSNLDWGQDLLAVQKWQKAHPQDRLYLAYFGMADPAFYGIKYINIPGGFGPSYQLMSEPGVMAVSATVLQGTYANPRLRDFYEKYRTARPREVLEGTIYLFDYPLRENVR